MPDKYSETRRNWDKNNPEIIRESKAKYDQDNPVFAFRPTEELLNWLEEERWQDEQGKHESNAALLNRKLTQLMNLENQGH